MGLRATTPWAAEATRCQVLPGCTMYRATNHEWPA